MGRARSKALGGSCVIVLGVRCSPFSLLYLRSLNLGSHIGCHGKYVSNVSNVLSLQVLLHVLDLSSVCSFMSWFRLDR